MPEFKDYKGVCYRCGSIVIRDDSTECMKRYEDELAIYVFVEDPLVCPGCGYWHQYVRLWKNMEVSSEFGEIAKHENQ